MKRLFTLVLMMLVTSFIMAQTPVKKVAVMETKASAGVSDFQSQMVRGAMEAAVVTAKGYEGYDRTAFDVIMQEQNFQRSGAVDESQIKQLGQLAGVQYVLVTEASQEDGYFYILAKLLDVETGKYGNAYDVLCKQSPTDIKESCAELGSNLFGNGKGPSKKSNVNMIPVDQVAEVSAVNTQPSEEVDPVKRIKRVWMAYYMDGKRLTNERYMDLINGCSEAKATYDRGKKIKKAGYITLGCGVALLAVGIVNYAGGSDYGDNGINEPAVIGTAVCLASIPVFIWGKNVRNSAYKDYNDYCAKPATNLSLNVKNNSVGISLNF